MKTISALYKESHLQNYTASRIKGDEAVNFALDSKLNRESAWKVKSSSIVSSHKFCLRPAG